MCRDESAFDRLSKSVVTALGIFLCLFTLFEVNYNLMQPQSALAVFVGVGLALCFLTFAVHPRLANNKPLRYVDAAYVARYIGCGARCEHEPIGLNGSGRGFNRCQSAVRYRYV